MDGIIQHMQNITSVEDILFQKYAEINVPSSRTSSEHPSSDRKVVFGIENTDYRKFWVTEDTEDVKYIFISLKYPISIEGIGIVNNKSDWYSQYLIRSSNDMIQWHEQTFDTSHLSFESTQRFYFELEESPPCRYINITPTQKALHEKVNYAFYGIEFFGTIHNLFRGTCWNLNHFFFKFFSISFTLFLNLC